MTSPERQKSRARLRLRDNAEPLDCLDLSRQSSSLLSPSVYPEFNGCHDFTENEFPFQVSPTDPATRKATYRDMGVSVHVHSKAQDTTQTAQTRGVPLTSLTNVQSSLAVPPLQKCTLPVSEPLTPVALYHHHQEEVMLYTLHIP